MKRSHFDRVSSVDKRTKTSASASPPPITSCAIMPLSMSARGPNIVSLGSDIASLIMSYLTESEMIRLLTTAKEVGSFTGLVAQYKNQPCVRCNDTLSQFSNDVNTDCSCCCENPAPLASVSILHISPFRLAVRTYIAHRVMPVPYGHILTPTAVDFVTSHICKQCGQNMALCYNSMTCSFCMQKSHRLVTYTRTELQRTYGIFGTRAQVRAIVSHLIYAGERHVYWSEIVTRLEETYGNGVHLAQHLLNMAKIDRLTLFVSFLDRPTTVHKYLFQHYLPTLLNTRGDSSNIIKTLKNGTLNLFLFQSVPQPQLIMNLPMLQFPKSCIYLLSQHHSIESLQSNEAVKATWSISKAYNSLKALILRSFSVCCGISPTHQLARVCAWIILMESVHTRLFMLVALGACTPATLDETILNIQVSVSKLQQLLIQYVSGECTLQTVSQFKIHADGACFDAVRLKNIWDLTIKILSQYWTPPGIASVQRLHRLLWAVQLASMWHDKCPFLLNTEKLSSQRSSTPIKKGFLHFASTSKVNITMFISH